MAFSRNELLGWEEMSRDRYIEVKTELLNKLTNGENLTIAESKFICMSLKTLFKAGDNSQPFKATDFKQCSNFIFWETYLQYWDDLEGWGRIKNGPESYVQDEIKIRDVKFLNDHFLNWKQIINHGKGKDAILDVVTLETQRLVKELLSYSKAAGEGSNRRDYIEKAIYLHSKYVYFQVKEYYEENPKEETLDLCGELIIIDHFVYIHTLLGHFAAGVKFNRQNKTYHTTKNVDYRNIPKELSFLLTKYIESIDCRYFNKQHIYLQLKGIDYVIYFRKLYRSIKGKGQKSFLRVQTYYPVEFQSDKKRIKMMNVSRVDDNLLFYIKT